MAEDFNAARKGFREIFTCEHCAGQDGFVLSMQRFKQPLSDTVRRREPLHAGDTQGFEVVWQESVEFAMEGSRWKEGSALDAGLCEFAFPRRWHRPGGSEDVIAVKRAMLTGPRRPIRRGHKRGGAVNEVDAASFVWREPAFGEVAAWLHAEGLKQRRVDVSIEHTFWSVCRRCCSQRSRDLNEHQRAEEQSMRSTSGHVVWFC